MKLDKATLEILGLEYQSLKTTIENAESRQAEIKDKVRGLLPAYDETLTSAEQAWQAGPSLFQWVKGRVTTTLDKDKLRKKLALAGVSLAIIDEAFESASTTKLSGHSIRITAADPNLEED